jgi:hypothetical protein
MAIQPPVFFAPVKFGYFARRGATREISSY